MIKESGVADRLAKTAQNGLMNVITIFLGLTVGATAKAETFLTPATLGIVALGLIAFCFSTAGGLLLGKLMCKLTHGKVNPLIGSAGVSAVPMAARVSQVVGQEGKPLKLPAHARYGSECCRSYRFCRCGRRIPRYVRSLILK